MRAIETKQHRLTVVPITVAAANRVVRRVHRHHPACPPSLVYFALGAVDLTDSRICGAAIVGRPANRNSDTGQIGEVLRVATDGTPNAPSALYGACSRVARRMGFSRLITYSLDEEPGTSLRAAGWELEKTGIESQWQRYQNDYSKSRSVQFREHYEQTKQRWAVSFRPSLEFVDDLAAASLVGADQQELGLGA